MIEVTIDDGVNWKDVAEFGTIPYNGVIGDSPVKRRTRSRTATASWGPTSVPHDQLALDFGNYFAGKTVKLRFRIATDSAVPAQGRRIHNIDFNGITDYTPFSGIVLVRRRAPAKAKAKAKRAKAKKAKAKKAKAKRAKAKRAKAKKAKAKAKAKARARSPTAAAARRRHPRPRPASRCSRSRSWASGAHAAAADSAD